MMPRPVAARFDEVLLRDESVCFRCTQVDIMLEYRVPTDLQAKIINKGLFIILVSEVDYGVAIRKRFAK